MICPTRHACVCCTLLLLSVTVARAQGGDASSYAHLKARQGSTWAIIVSTSSGWHDYRHALNALSMYEQLARCASTSTPHAIPVSSQLLIRFLFKAQLRTTMSSTPWCVRHYAFDLHTCTPHACHFPGLEGFDPDVIP